MGQLDAWSSQQVFIYGVCEYVCPRRDGRVTVAGGGGRCKGAGAEREGGGGAQHGRDGGVGFARRVGRISAVPSGIGAVLISLAVWSSIAVWSGVVVERRRDGRYERRDERQS